MNQFLCLSNSPQLYPQHFNYWSLGLCSPISRHQTSQDRGLASEQKTSLTNFQLNVEKTLENAAMSRRRLLLTTTAILLPITYLTFSDSQISHTFTRSLNSTVAISAIIIDYKLSQPSSSLHQRGADWLLWLAHKNGGVYTKFVSPFFHNCWKI